MAIERFSVISQQEAMQQANSNAKSQAQEDILVLQEQNDEKKSKSARGLRMYGTFNILSGAAWGTAAVFTGGAVAVGAGIMAAVDGAQAVGSFAGARALENRQKKQEEQASQGEPLRTRESGRSINSGAEGINLAHVGGRKMQQGKPVNAMSAKELEKVA